MKSSHYTFTSRKDILFLLTTLIPLGFALITFINSQIISFNPVIFILTLLIAFGLFWFIYSWLALEYLIDEGSIKIKTGRFLLKEMKITEINSMHRSYNFINHFTTSFKRIRLDNSKKHIYISPSKEKELISVILEINPNIHIGDSLK